MVAPRPACRPRRLAVMSGSARRQDQERIGALQRQVRELEGLVGELSRRAGIGPAELHVLRGQTVPSGITPAIQDLVARGKVIEAIKEYRSETGAGLKEAKDAIDAYREGGGLR